jgi:ubiquinone/menaquinone biosynthesis C-methylase UbiE
MSDILDGVVIARVERVLDVGCGAGQALFPLAVSEGAFGVGVDISEMGLRLAREFYATHLPHAKITFLRAKAESLPFPAQSFDVVNCGLALPYMNNARAFAEIARVLRPGGIFLLKIHHETEPSAAIWASENVDLESAPQQLRPWRVRTRLRPRLPGRLHRIGPDGRRPADRVSGRR